jgi:hypothetical protein
MRLLSTITAFVLGVACMAHSQQENPVNFQHLESLTETIQFLGDTVDIIHIYSQYPDYRWHDATDSAPEGIACVDDAARAAVLYLRHVELTGVNESLYRAKRLLRFVMKMQAQDGQWYNFIFGDHSINTDGQTSRKMFGWWAARAIWALGTGYHVFADQDPSFVRRIKTSLDRSLPQIDSLLSRFGQYDTVAGYATPRWLVNESGADATSELLLGLTEYYRVTKSARVKSMIQKLADGIMAMQVRDTGSEAFGLFRSWRTLWHAWGNGQTQALATAGTILKDKRMIRAAEREARAWYGRLLTRGFIKELDLTNPQVSRSFPQISYDVRPVVVGLVRLHEATGRMRYLKMAGLMASWFFGNNPADRAMYDPATGRAFDGIGEGGKVNLNSGAESTIEALAVMMELDRAPSARPYCEYRAVSRDTSSSKSYCLYQNKTSDVLLLVFDEIKKDLRIMEGHRAKKALRQLRSRRNE